MVNPGSGGKKASLLLGLDVQEIEFSNFVGREGSLEDLQTISVKICPLNDPHARNQRMADIREKAKTRSKPGRRG